jgi:hypothetical protein
MVIYCADQRCERLALPGRTWCLYHLRVRERGLRRYVEHTFPSAGPAELNRNSQAFDKQSETVPQDSNHPF